MNPVGQIQNFGTSFEPDVPVNIDRERLLYFIIPRAMLMAKMKLPYRQLFKVGFMALLISQDF